MFKIFLTSILFTLLSLAGGSILKTGLTQSYASDGNIVTDGSVKDDGYYQTGLSRSYSRSASGVVTEHAIGLEWQDDVASVQKPWIAQANYNAGNYNDTSGDTAATYCSGLTLDGGGWRLPTREEIRSLRDFARTSPAIDPVFIHHAYSGDYWSSTSIVNSPEEAWFIYFAYGVPKYARKYNSKYVRCVRGGELKPSVLSRSGVIVTDSSTGLQWQDDTTGASYINWNAAIEHCEGLGLGGHTNWRLPNLNELASIIDDTKYHAIDSSKFQNIDIGRSYWSSTSVQSMLYRRYIINFIGHSKESTDHTVSSHSAVCVRLGKFDHSPLLFTDFTNNDSNDFLWHQSGTGAVRIMEMNSTTQLGDISVVSGSNLNLIPKGIGDFDGDGKVDILVHNQNTGMARAWLMDGTTRTENVALLDSSNTNLQIAGIGDFDGDGDSDIATFNGNSGALIIWVMDGTTKLYNEKVLSGANLNLVPRGVGDMNNDGIPDIILRNTNSGAVRVWTMNSDFTRKGNEYVTGSSNTNLELRGVTDINGDGNNDILNYNTNTGKLRAWLMDGHMGINENAEIIQETDLDWSVRN